MQRNFLVNKRLGWAHEVDVGDGAWVNKYICMLSNKDEYLEIRWGAFGGMR